MVWLKNQRCKKNFKKYPSLTIIIDGVIMIVITVYNNSRFDILYNYRIFGMFGVFLILTF